MYLLEMCSFRKGSLFTCLRCLTHLRCLASLRCLTWLRCLTYLRGLKCLRCLASLRCLTHLRCLTYLRCLCLACFTKIWFYEYFFTSKHIFLISATFNFLEITTLCQNIVFATNLFFVLCVKKWDKYNWIWNQALEFFLLVCFF